jgi:hypothetical protein
MLNWPMSSPQITRMFGLSCADAVPASAITINATAAILNRFDLIFSPFRFTLLIPNSSFRQGVYQMGLV